MNIRPETSINTDAIAEFVKNAKPKTSKGLVNLFFWTWGILILGIVPYIIFPSIWTFAVAFLVVTSRMSALLFLAHDAHHAAFLPKKKWNDFLAAWFCAYPVGSIWGSARAVHMAHHKLLNTPEDPDRFLHIETNKSSPKQFAMHFVRLLGGGQLWTSIVVNGFLRPMSKNKQVAKSSDSNLAVPVAVPRHGHPEILNLVPVQLVIWGLLWLASGQWWLYFALWLGPIFTLGAFLNLLRGFVDHGRLKDEEDGPARDRLITVLDVNWLERAYLAPFNFNYHAEHHFFPTVPPYHLAELHKLMQANEAYRNSYGIRHGYGRFILEYWRQICGSPEPQPQAQSKPAADQA